MLVCAALAIAPGSAQPLVKPEFDVASIKPCWADLPPDARSGGNSSPELLAIDCQTVRSLIGTAYVAFATGVRVTPLKVPIEGGPAWIGSERYEIKARAEGVKNQAMMYGPLLQALLEDRFQLRIHRETREAPVYALIVLKKGAKLRPFKEESCNPYDITASFPPPPATENPCLTRGEMKDGVPPSMR